MTASAHWYALRVRHKAERAAAEALRIAGVEEFLPLAPSRRRWSDRWKTIAQPLFPGYLFCRLALDFPKKIVQTPGVLGFVGFRRGPEPIPDAEIEAVRRLLDSGRRLRTAAILREGQPVRVTAGPLEGIHGTLVRIKDDEHLVVNIELLQRSLAVTLAGDEVSPHA